jgi:hypothetical protein
MLKRLSIEKIELLLASALIPVLVSLSADLPYTGLCTFFFGEPEYPFDK